MHRPSRLKLSSTFNVQIERPSPIFNKLSLGLTNYPQKKGPGAVAEAQEINAALTQLGLLPSPSAGAQ